MANIISFIINTIDIIILYNSISVSKSSSILSLIVRYFYKLIKFFLSKFYNTHNVLHIIRLRFLTI